MIKAQILVVEDQTVTAQLIIEVLQAGGFDAQSVGTLAKARARLGKNPPELLILDRNLPDGDGIDLLAEIRADEKLTTLPVIILTAEKDVADKIAGLHIGADDYMAKPFNTEELVARVEALLRRSGMGGDPVTLESSGIKLDREARKSWVEGLEIPLSAKEFDLLWFLVYRKNRVLTRDFLLQHVWGYDAGVDLTTKVIDVTLSHLKQKLGAPSEKIVAVRGFGYRFDA
ncbi:MAG: response regulator transcription factor [Elusimicrobiota bacterium]